MGKSMKSFYSIKLANFLNFFSTNFFYHSAEMLFLIWFFLFSFIFFSLKITQNIYQLGMISTTRDEGKFELSVDGKKRKKFAFKYINYDNPVSNIFFIRLFGVILNYLSIVFCFIIFANLLLNIIFYFLSLGKMINLKYYKYYLFSEYNVYGIAWIAVAFALAVICYLIIYHKYTKQFFSELDKKVNESMISNIKKSDLRSGSLLDVKDLKFNEVDIYDPSDYYQEAKQKDSLFLGIDDESTPIFYKKSVWNETNVQIIGKMGSGKGVLATSVFIQCYENYNDFNVWFDPKNDEWAYSVFKNKSKKDQFFYIDLNRDAEPQFNIFQDITVTELNELFVAGFGLGRTGTNADFYKIGDRKVCRELANQFEDETDNININTIMEKWNKLPNDLKQQGSSFFGQLEELSELKCIQTDKGINLKDIITGNKPGMLYITGSLRDENVVMLQKMLLLRITQIIEKRDRKQDLTHINIMLDEVRYILSKNTLEMMGTIRDKKANIIYTHQSLGDLVGASQDLDPASTKNIMLDNVGLRWIYKLDIKDSAEWASNLTSETLKDVERRTLSLNDANVEMASKETTIFKQKANYIETSVIQNLPKRCGLIIGLEGLPKLAYSSPIIVSKLDKVLQIAPRLELTYKKTTPKNKVEKQPVKKQKKNETTVDKELLNQTTGLEDFLASKLKKDKNLSDEIMIDIESNPTAQPTIINHEVIKD